MVVSRQKCLLMHLSTTITPPVGTHNRVLVYKQPMNDNMVKRSCNNIKHVFIGAVMIVENVHISPHDYII